MDALVIVPTFNEAENISQLLPRLLKDFDESLHILVVDDNSPDGTGEIVKGFAKDSGRVHLLSREKKQGLGKAYLAGFSWGLARSYKHLIEMDADFSHRPEDLKKIVEQLHKGSDFVIGSRYVPGGQTVNWGLIRKIISRGGGLYSRLILGFPIQDWTGGFNGWKRETLMAMKLDQVSSNGYCFQIELKYRASLAEKKGLEVPIVFEDRRVGQSKMSLNIVLEAFYKVWSLKWTIK